MKRHFAAVALAGMLLSATIVGAQDQSDPYNNQNGQDQADPYAPRGGSQQPTMPPPPPGQQAPSTSDQTPPPGIARLSYVHGDVSSQHSDNGQWEAGTVNTPIEAGDRVSTGQGGRAELQLDYANVLRLSDGTTAKIANISRDGIQVQIGQGLATYSVLKGGEASAEIDTPNAAIHPNGPGEYRISVDAAGQTIVIVRGNSADITEPQGSTQVENGQMITIQGTDSPEYKISSAPVQDAWDSWNSDRDRHTGNAQSWHHTDRYYTGSDDLDPYGTWSEVPDYGPVWTPQQGPDWSPYSSGRWVWEPGWGWTWVSYEPWGWAPYHYGRWMVYGGNWVWWPGPVVAYPGYYPVWAPAYVNFFGWGGIGFGVGFGFGFGFGHVGWLPCGPGDWFHPWWGGWGGRYNTYNIHNTTIVRNGFAPLGPRGERSFSNVHEAFSNARVRGGFNSMDSNHFGHGGFSAEHGISETDFRQASMVSGKMPLHPSRDSFGASNHAANSASFRNAPSASQHFFTNNSRVGAGFSSRGSTSFNNNARGQSGFSGNRNVGSFNRAPSNSVESARGISGSVQSGRPGWHTFTPSQGGANNTNNRSTTNDGYSRSNENSGFRSSASAPRSGSSNSYNNSYRPPLNMRQPIVTPRGGNNYGSAYGRNPYGNSGSRPSYNTPHSYGNSGTYNAPRSFGGNSGSNAPRSYNAPRSFSTPHNSGGSGGGGNHGGGGSHSGGGHSGGGGHGGHH